MRDVPIVEESFTRDGGREAARTILADHPGTTAILALNDDMAIGSLSELRVSGVQVPGEMSVTGFDDVAVAGDLSPALTTVRLPMGDMGQRCLSLVLKEPGTRPRRQTVPAELVEAATIPNIPFARMWGDVVPPDLAQRVGEIKARVAALPPEVRDHARHYLAISGGGSNGAYGAGLLTGWTESGKRPSRLSKRRARRPGSRPSSFRAGFPLRPPEVFGAPSPSGCRPRSSLPRSWRSTRFLSTAMEN